jgi:hypothetical protein
LKAYRPPQFYQEKTEQPGAYPARSRSSSSTEGGAKEIGEEKSEVQMVHEYAHFLKKSVEYEVSVHAARRRWFN